MSISVSWLITIVVITLLVGMCFGILIVGLCVAAKDDPREDVGHCGTCGGLLDFGLLDEKEGDDEEVKQ